MHGMMHRELTIYENDEVFFYPEVVDTNEHVCVKHHRHTYSPFCETSPSAIPDSFRC